MQINIKTNLSLLLTINSSIRIAFNAPTSSTILPNENKNWQSVCLSKRRAGYSHFTSFLYLYEIHTSRPHRSTYLSFYSNLYSFQTKFKVEYQLNNQLYVANRNIHSFWALYAMLISTKLFLSYNVEISPFYRLGAEYVHTL